MLNKTKKTNFPWLYPCICTLMDRFHLTSRGYVCIQNNESAAMFVYKKKSVGIGLFSHVKTFFHSKQFANLLTTWLKTIYRSWATTNHSLACVAFTSLYKYQYFIVVVAGLFKSSKAFTSHFVFERETMRYSPKMVRYKIEMSWFRTWMKRFRTHVT